MLACKSGYLDLVRVLIQQGADLNSQDKEGVTAFGHAITSEKGDNIGLIELLIEKGADVTRGKFEWNGEEEKRRRNDKKIKGFSGIKGDMGSYSEIHKKKKFYVKSGRNVREGKQSRKGLCGFEGEPVGIALRRRFEAVAVKLLQMTSNVHKKDSFSGNSYLHLAVFYRNWNVVDFLLKKGLHPDEKNNHEKSAWHFCQDEDAELTLKSFVQTTTCEPNFKKKKFKKNRKKRKKKKQKLNKEQCIKDHDTKTKISIDPNSSQNASSKGGFLLSQLSLDPDSQGNKLLNDISAQNSSNQTKSRKDRNLWDDLSADSKLDLKNNLSTDRSTQDLHSVYAQKNELKVECRKLETRLKKLMAENEFFTKEDSKNSWSMLLERRLSDLHQSNPQEDSVISESIPCVKELKQPKGDGSSAGRLLDLISNQSATSAVKKGISQLEEKPELEKQEGCFGCLGMISKIPFSAESERLHVKLGKEVLNFEKEISLLNSINREKYLEIKKKIESMIFELYQGPFSLKVYGSFANGLNIPGSDLDLLLIFNNSPKSKAKSQNNSKQKRHSSKHRLSEHCSGDQSTPTKRKYTEPYYPDISQNDFQLKLLSDNVMEDLNDKAQNLENYFVKSQYLRNAFVPVLKLETQEDLGGFPVDVTVHDPRHQGIECVELVKNLVKKYPPLKPIALVLKQLLNKSGLSDPYTGGLSSYGLVVMIVSYFQIFEFREFEKENFERQMEENKRNSWVEDPRNLKRRHQRNGSFANGLKNLRNSQKSGLNGQFSSIQSRKNSASKKRVGKNKNENIESQNSFFIFSKTGENVGKLLMGFLYYFGFVFNMNMQKINIFMEGDDPHYPIQQVKFK